MILTHSRDNLGKGFVEEMSMKTMAYGVMQCGHVWKRSYMDEEI